MVQLSSVDEATAAIQALNGQDFAGLMAGGQAQQQSQQQPQQQWSVPTQSQAAGGSGSGHQLEVKYAGTGLPSDNLYIKGLPSPEVDKDTLNAMFTSLGFTVLRSRTMPDMRGQGNSAAMVQLSSVDEATAAIQALNGQDFAGLMTGGQAQQQSQQQPQQRWSAPTQSQAAGGSGSD